MAVAPESFHLLPFDTQFFASENFSIQNDDEEEELLLILDATMAEEMQFQEVLKASLSSFHNPSFDEKLQGAGTSLSFCEICRERKEEEKLFKNGECGHSFCLDHCLTNYLEANIKNKEGFNIVTCPSSDCNCVLKLESFKHLLSGDVINLWEKAVSMDFASTSKELHVKTKPENGNEFEDSDSDEYPDTDDYDSDASPRKIEACKKSKWFKKFLKGLQNLSSEEVKDQARQWHCPACQGGAGAIKRYLGLQALIQHAKTKGSTRIRLHGELAELLEDKLHSNNQPLVSAATGIHESASPKWKGLSDDNNDFEMVWPPTIIIANTIYKKDENHKQIGLSSEELLQMFSSYDGIVKVQHPYNFKGHCGFSFLIFESSVKGYLEAERLATCFTREGMGRDAFFAQRPSILSSEQLQLYGFMAVKEDVDFYNDRFFKGKLKLKYEMRSYQEMVVKRMKQMIDENYELLRLKNKVSEQERHAKELEESNSMLKEKLQIFTKDMNNLRRNAKQQHEQSKEEIEFLEKFYKDQIRTILDGRNGNGGDFDNVEEEKSEEEQENVEQLNASLFSDINHHHENWQHQGKKRMAESFESAMNKAPIVTEETPGKLVVKRRGLKAPSGSEERHEYLDKLRQKLLGKKPLTGEEGLMV